MRPSSLARRVISHGTLALGTLALGTLAVGTLAACGGDEELPAVAEAQEALVVECIDLGEPAPEGAWICGEDRVVECSSHGGGSVRLIHASLDALQIEAACDELHLAASAEGPFPVGDSVIEVSEVDGAPLCASRLTVVDTTPPKPGGGYLELWPPNHELYWLLPEECAAGASDVCDPDVRVELLWATSDEPLDDTGDGDTEEDIVDLGCDGVGLRAERAGDGDGRVYRVAYRVSDDHGNAAEGGCVVVVRHDQGDMGAVQANVEAYRVDLQGCP